MCHIQPWLQGITRLVSTLWLHSDFASIQEGDGDGLFEESFRSHTDSKPKGPQGIGFDVSFPGSQHVYGIPQHATSLALKATVGACRPQAARFRNHGRHELPSKTWVSHLRSTCVNLTQCDRHMPPYAALSCCEDAPSQYAWVCCSCCSAIAVTSPSSTHTPRLLTLMCPRVCARSRRGHRVGALPAVQPGRVRVRARLAVRSVRLRAVCHLAQTRRHRRRLLVRFFRIRMLSCLHDKDTARLHYPLHTPFGGATRHKCCAQLRTGVTNNQGRVATYATD